jgi:DNA-binding MarR family transcriptional regulator
VTRPGAVLTERDAALLRSLAKMRFLTSTQVRRLHFPSEPTALRRIRRLEEAGLVTRMASPTVPSQLVSLTAQGLATAVDGDDIAPGRTGMRPPRVPRPLFLRHLVAVNEFRIELLASLKARDDVELLGFVTDSDRQSAGPGRRPYSPLAFSIDLPGEAPIRHAADAAFMLQRGDRRALFLLEMDLATEVIGQGRHGVGRLVRFYLHTFANGLAQTSVTSLVGDRPPHAIRALIVTPSRRRLENIRRVWGSKPFTPEAVKRLIWLADFDQLRTDLLSLPWVSLDPADGERYRMASGSGEK